MLFIPTWLAGRSCGIVKPTYDVRATPCSEYATLLHNLRTRYHRSRFVRLTKSSETNPKLLLCYCTAHDEILHKLKGNTSDLPGVHELAETYFGTHFLYRLLHLFAPLPDRECLPFPPCQMRTVHGPVAGHSGFLHGCTRCVHLGLFEHE
jgi:hypothetical protein